MQATAIGQFGETWELVCGLLQANNTTNLLTLFTSLYPEHFGSHLALACPCCFCCILALSLTGFGRRHYVKYFMNH